MKEPLFVRIGSDWHLPIARPDKRKIRMTHFAWCEMKRLAQERGTSRQMLIRCCLVMARCMLEMDTRKRKYQIGDEVWIVEKIRPGR